MKGTLLKGTLLAATLTITQLPSLALGCDFQGDLFLASQADVDAASIYCGVTGNLTISGADIVDLSPLAGFLHVGGYVLLDGNPSLTQVIDVFPSLTDVGGGMFFYNNDSLLELSGFDALLQTGDNIDFWFNDVLMSVSGFASLHTAGWSLEFGGNPDLVEIPEFLSLQTINSSLFILDNPQLESITGFEALQFVSWSFQIQDNTSLNNLCGLYNYFNLNNPYPGGGAFDITNNGPDLPNPTTEQDVIDAGPCDIGTPYCFGDGSGTPCPCGNEGASGEGCANTSGSGGLLVAGGSASASADDLTFAASQLIPGQPALLFAGVNTVGGGDGIPFGDGLRCAGGSVVRLGVETPDSGGGAAWGPGLGATGGWGLGDVRRFQVWYRDPSGPCGSGYNLTNGMELTFIP